MVPARYILAILGSFGMAIIYGLKVNLSVAMVAMINHTALSHHQPPVSIHHNVTHLLTASNPSSDSDCQESSSSAKIEVCCWFWSANESIKRIKNNLSAITNSINSYVMVCIIFYAWKSNCYKSKRHKYQYWPDGHLNLLPNAVQLNKMSIWNLNSSMVVYGRTCNA